MKIYTEKSDRKMCNELQEKLEEFRLKRNFSALEYIKNKTELLNMYMKKFNLDTCVVAISGGIDSAVVLAIINEAAKRDNVIKNIIPISLPCYDNTGVTGQTSAKNRAVELCGALNVKPYVLNINSIAKEIQKNVDNTLDMTGKDWAVGQLVSYSRTPILYYTTSLLNQEGYKPIICGTTNLSEGQYLGYVGKSGDGMVDVQLISDIYKSEVYKVAEKLNIPKSILNVTPTGDMYDNRIDEEVFGASYDFVELYMYFLHLNKSKKDDFKQSLSIEALSEFVFYSKNLEKLHKYNKHKYLAKSPAIHLDLYDSGLINGWDNYRDTLKEIFYE